MDDQVRMINPAISFIPAAERIDAIHIAVLVCAVYRISFAVCGIYRVRLVVLILGVVCRQIHTCRYVSIPGISNAVIRKFDYFRCPLCADLHIAVCHGDLTGCTPVTQGIADIQVAIGILCVDLGASRANFCIYRVLLILHQTRSACGQLRCNFVSFFIVQSGILRQTAPAVSNVQLFYVCLGKCPASLDRQITGDGTVCGIPALEGVNTVDVVVCIVRIYCISRCKCPINGIRLSVDIGSAVGRRIHTCRYRHSCPLVSDVPCLHIDNFYRPLCLNGDVRILHDTIFRILPGAQCVLGIDISVLVMGIHHHILLRTVYCIRLVVHQTCLAIRQLRCYFVSFCII